MRRTVLLVVAICLPIGIATGLATYLFGYREQGPGPTTARTTPAARMTSPPAPANTDFDISRVMATVDYLAGNIGPREEGTDGELRAAEYIHKCLNECGYRPVRQPVKIETTGRVGSNVTARLPGTGRPDRVIVLGAHMDSLNGPGANDNATGCAALLELARVLKGNQRHVPSIDFVFFCGEEVAAGGTRDDDHWGSRTFVNSLNAVEKQAIAGMVCIDMIGSGSEFRARNMGLASPALRDMMLDFGAGRGLIFKADRSPYGNSDHEPFEKSGIPSVWLEYGECPVYHQPSDTIQAVDAAHVQNVGCMLQGFFEQYLTPERMALLPTRQ